MTQNEVQDFADETKLDVRPIQPYQWRLMNEFGKYILDVYFKKNKRGVIIKNSVLKWEGEKWTEAHSVKDLKKLLTG